MKNLIILCSFVTGLLFSYNAYSQKSLNNYANNITSDLDKFIFVNNNTNIDDISDFLGVAEELVADFMPSEREIIAGDCISFQDQSIGAPIQWFWSFPGAATTSSTLQNPTNICYRIPGTYNVILEVRRNTDRHTFVFENCITVGINPELPYPNFEADALVVPVNGIVKFKNKTTNGPCDQWVWTFGDNASPTQSTDSTPSPVVYREPGLYPVTLRCRKTNGIQNIITKTEYIKVVEISNEEPVANFTSNFKIIKPGQSVNFFDMSTGNPYKWNWIFEGSSTLTSTLENPTNITYPQAGKYKVTLTVKNNIGTNEITFEEFIIVSATDPCLDDPENSIPIADFSADVRLFAQNGEVRFKNLSKNYPAYNYWTFEGGEPYSSDEASPSMTIKYKTPGVYKVMLTSANECGSNTITKEKYIYVFNNDVYSYCETISTVYEGDYTEVVSYPGVEWGYIAGHSSRKIREYANYFDRHSFNEIQAVEIPVALANAGDNNSYIRLKVWDGKTDVPNEENLLGEQNVYLRNLVQGQVNKINFDPPIKINGPFYLGYRLNYTVDLNEDGITDDLFVCKIVTRKAPSSPTDNTLFVLTPGSAGWQPFNSIFGYNSALDISPISCLVVGIDPVSDDSEVSIFPNPSTGLVNVKIASGNVRNFDVEIYDALGRKCFAELSNTGQDEYSIDLSGQPQGIYVIRVITDIGTINKKLLLTK